MWTRRPRVRASEPDCDSGLSRRGFLAGSAAVLAAPWLRPLVASAASELPAATVGALEKSGLVYVSPLRRDGSESTCHGEVWFDWRDGAVHLTTARTTWKARSQAKGLDRARVWVGDHGRWKRALGRNQAFRQAPHFDARVRVVEDPAVVAKVLVTFARKYPAEFPSWKGKMERGHADGSRILLRYDPV